MNILIRTMCVMVLIWVSLTGWAQSADEIQYQKHLEQGARFRNVQLYLECLKEGQAAVDLARKNNWTERYIAASISLAEWMRASENWYQGIDILKGLKNTEAYPQLHVKKLGRLAALYHEGKFPNEFNQLDSVRRYLDLAVVLAVEQGFKGEEASLKNELGYFVSKNEDIRQGLAILLESAEIFINLADTRNYVGAMTHVLDDHIELDNQKKANEIGKELVSIIKGRNWYTNEVDIYNLLSKQCKYNQERLCELEWKNLARKSFVKHTKAINTQQMADFRIVQETQKFQKDAREATRLAEQKEQALKEEEAHTRELRLYLALILIFVLAVVGILIRERKLKRTLNRINEQLEDANQKYLTLLVESNHRIKNNLQMVISMLEYASKDLNDVNSVAFKRMSGKIHTISALHKHLYMNVHNEQVEVQKYFNEIVEMYENISPDHFKLISAYDKASIESERIVYFGLIFNEMLTNTFEHSQNADKAITIEVVKQDEEEQYSFRYSDGSSYGSDYQEGNGIQLIRKLVKRVGGLNFSLDPETGQYQFSFYA